MKILQFAFDSLEDNDFLPHNYTASSVVYTGTHDNDTTLGWYQSASVADRAFAKDIKQYINLNASTVSGIISRLEGKGLVAKLPKPNDKRATYIILTAKGADLLHKSPPTLQEKLSQRLKKLTPGQIEELNRNIELLTLIMDVEDMDAAPLLTINEITNHPK